MLKVGYLQEAPISCHFGINFSFSSTSFKGIEKQFRSSFAHRSQLVSQQLGFPLVSTVLVILQIVVW